MGFAAQSVTRLGAHIVRCSLLIVHTILPKELNIMPIGIISKAMYAAGGYTAQSGRGSSSREHCTSAA